MSKDKKKIGAIVSFATGVVCFIAMFIIELYSKNCSGPGCGENIDAFVYFIPLVGMLVSFTLGVVFAMSFAASSIIENPMEKIDNTARQIDPVDVTKLKKYRGLLFVNLSVMFVLLIRMEIVVIERHGINVTRSNYLIYELFIPLVMALVLVIIYIMLAIRKNKIMLDLKQGKKNIDRSIRKLRPKGKNVCIYTSVLSDKKIRMNLIFWSFFSP